MPQPEPPVPPPQFRLTAEVPSTHDHPLARAVADGACEQPMYAVLPLYKLVANASSAGVDDVLLMVSRCEPGGQDVLACGQLETVYVDTHTQESKPSLPSSR